MALLRTCTLSLLAVLLLHLVYADVTYSDLPGTYELERGNLDICTTYRTLEVLSESTTITSDTLLFNNEQCSTASFDLSEYTSIEGWSREVTAAVGNIVHGDGYISCGSFESYFITFMRATTSVQFPMEKYVSPFTVLPDVTYLVLTSDSGQCIYERVSGPPKTVNNPQGTGAGTSKGTKSGSRRKPGSARKTKSTKKKSGLKKWIWVVPVLLIAAVVVIILYLYRRKQGKSPDPEPAPAPAAV